MRRILYRYRVAEVWGCMEGRVEAGDILLECSDHGPERQGNVFDRKLGKVTGGWVADYVDIAETCACGKFLVGAPNHQCPGMGA